MVEVRYSIESVQHNQLVRGYPLGDNHKLIGYMGAYTTLLSYTY